MRRDRRSRQRKIPEALGNRVCGIWPYVLVLLLNAAVHAVFLLRYARTPESILRLLLSFFFFISPPYYVADTLWSLRPSVRDILSGKIPINRRYYMNTPRREFSGEELLPVTISVPVHMENNRIIFETLRQSLTAVRRYRQVSGRAANVLVSDDGLARLLDRNWSQAEAERLLRRWRDDPAALTEGERKAAERLSFYRRENIGFVARPAAGRAGLFKKASNLNYTLRLGNAVSGGASLAGLLRQGGAFAGGYAEGDITTHEVILLLDKDSGLHERILEAILPEFSLDERLAYVQCATSAGNLSENYYTYVTGHQTNNLFHSIWPCKAMQGYFVPLIGHNVFLRKSVLEKSGFWAEDKVSEDYDRAICFYGMGYHGKYAQIRGLEFSEYASRTFMEETGRQRRYAYGLLEMIFDGTVVPGKTRPCDIFYMLLYFCTMINQILLLPAALLESYFGNIHLLWAGSLFCIWCFVFFSLLRGLIMRRHLPRGHAETVIHSLLIAVSYVGHSFSFLAGALRYLANRVKEIRKPFPATSVDEIDYRFGAGVRLLAGYVRQNPLFLLLSFLCLDRGVFCLTNRALPTPTKFTYGYILFCAVLAPLLLTPQLLGSLGRKRVPVGHASKRRPDDVMRRHAQNTLLSGRESLPPSRMLLETQPNAVPDGDLESFLASYRETLGTALPVKTMPEELVRDYEIESCLRRDAAGKKELYLLRRRVDGQRALLRVTRDYPEEDALEEAKLLARLDHPGIPKVFAAYEKDGRKYLVREYLEGRSLYEIVQTGGSLAARDIFGIALKLANILHYLHAQQPPVIHRDLKPQNIIAGKDGGIHLIDFGIARVHKAERRQDTSVVLTLDYASPEQYGFEQTTPLSDIYSLGVVLLYLATGRTTRSDLELQIVNNRLRNLIELCIAFNPKARIQSAEGIRDYLLHGGSGRTATRRRRRALAAAIAIPATALLLSSGAGFVTGKMRAEERGRERGYSNGYTDGYVAVPVFLRHEAGSPQVDGSRFGNMAVTGGAFAAEGDGRIFYLTADGIWCMSAGGAEKTLIVPTGGAAALSYRNGWLYYSSGKRILQTNLYTDETDVLYDGLAGLLYVAGENFFLRTEEGLHRLDIETGTLVQLALDDIGTVLGSVGSSWYSVGADRGLYRWGTGDERESLLAAGQVRSAELFGAELYCSIRSADGDSLIRLDCDGGGSTTLFEASAVLLQVTADGICYLDQADGTIRRASFDGRMREIVSKNRARDFNLAGDWVFYHNERDDGRLWCVRLDGSNDHPVP